MKNGREILPRTCVAAQHRQMLGQVLDVFHIEPNRNLNIMRDNRSLFDITSSVLRKLERVLEEEKPDVVLA